MGIGNVSKRQQPDQKVQKQQYATNGSSTQQENPAQFVLRLIWIIITHDLYINHFFIFDNIQIEPSIFNMKRLIHAQNSTLTLLLKLIKQGISRI